MLIALSCIVNASVQANNDVAKQSSKTNLDNKEKSSLMADKLIFPVITISGGMSLATTGGNPQEPSTATTKTGTRNFIINYNADKLAQSKALFSLFAGAEWRITPTIAWQPGISYYQAAPLKVRGNRTTDLPLQDVNTYHYRIQSKPVFFENKLLMTFKENFHPYVSLGLGVSFNKASAFTRGY